MTKVSKKNKLSFYIQGFLRGVVPVKSFDKKINELYKNVSKDELKIYEKRVDDNYKKDTETKVLHDGTVVKKLLKPRTPKSYYF